MKIATAEEMSRIDRSSIEHYGILPAVLMERAGLAVAERIRDLYPLCKVQVLCGPGNNGGDGIVAARILHTWGYRVAVHMLCRRSALSSDCQSQLRIAEKFGIPCVFNTTLAPAELHGAVVVDALLGTGLSRAVTGSLAETIRQINDLAAPVVAVDIPSGISSDTGAIMGEAVRAAHTVTFGLPKRGHYFYPGTEHTGSLTIADIGFPPALLDDHAIVLERVDAASASRRIPERSACGYKNMFGHVLVVAGSTGKTGAALMTAKACLRAGAGLVTLGVPETLLDVFMGRVAEEMLLPLPDDGSGELAPFAADEIVRHVAERFDILAIGPGLGRSDAIARIVADVVLHCRAPLVIDADGLYALSRRANVLQSAKAPIILTPHEGELRRFASLGQQAHLSRFDAALSLAIEHGVYVVAKGAPTITTLPERRVFLNTTGNAGMATAGTGDVLTGVIAGLLAQHLAPADAAVLGGYLHGLSGDLAAERVGSHSLIATDVIDALPAAFLALQSVAH